MQYSIMIKPASGHCNLRCKYCFYIDECNMRDEYSMGMMRPADAEILVDRVLDQLSPQDSITFAFQGGEPTLAGISYFESFTTAVKRHSFTGQVHYALQTNGFVIDKEWAIFLHQHNFLVGLSLDGPAQYHDANRVDIHGEGTHGQIIKVKRLFDTYKVEYNILTVLTERAARHPQEYWNFILKNKIRYIQFVPCLAELSGENANKSALTPQRFASFYSALFPLWAKELMQGNYISVKFFDDLFNLLLHRNCTACGFTGHCNIQLIVEANGSVYPCDFYVLDEWKLGNIYQDTLESLKSCDKGKAFLQRSRTDGLICKTCKYRNFCGGGCPRMEHAMHLTAEKTFCGYKSFLDQCYPLIDQVAQYLVRHQ
ncbi:MAG: SPASM domain-containing protein [Faecalibacterium sp.]